MSKQTERPGLIDGCTSTVCDQEGCAEKSDTWCDECNESFCTDHVELVGLELLCAGCRP